jgi:hypothetical protein
VDLLVIVSQDLLITVYLIAILQEAIQVDLLEIQIMRIFPILVAMELFLVIILVDLLDLQQDLEVLPFEIVIHYVM